LPGGAPDPALEHAARVLELVRGQDQHAGAGEPAILAGMPTGSSTPPSPCTPE